MLKSCMNGIYIAATRQGPTSTGDIEIVGTKDSPKRPFFGQGPRLDGSRIDRQATATAQKSKIRSRWVKCRVACFLFTSIYFCDVKQRLQSICWLSTHLLLPTHLYQVFQCRTSYTNHKQFTNQLYNKIALFFVGSQCNQFGRGGKEDVVLWCFVPVRQVGQFSYQ